MFVSFDDGTCRKEPTSDDVFDEVRSVVSGRRRLFGLAGTQYTSLTGHNFPHWAAGNLSFSRVSTIEGWLSLHQDAAPALTLRGSNVRYYPQSSFSRASRNQGSMVGAMKSDGF